MITGFDHVGLVVQNVENQLNFYCELLGLEVEHEKDVFAPPTGDHTGIPDVHRKLIFFRNRSGVPIFELIYYVKPKSPSGHALRHHQINGTHLCFKVKNLNEIYEDLVKRGVRFLTPPKQLTRPQGDTVCLAYAQDPEGNWIEFKEVLGDK
jgi:catechol 2,3-dioxygenase-like lactoylglutathione lyase family enzyme